MSSDVGSRLAKNSLFNIVRVTIAFPITLVILPFTLRSLGSEEFAIWALVGVISSYVQLSDFGVTESLIKFFAEYRTKNDDQKIVQLLNTALVLYMLLFLCVGSVLFLSLPLIVKQILNIPANLAGRATTVFALAILLFFLNLLTSAFSSLINGFQRMGYTNAISLANSILTAVGVFLFLTKGFGLMGLVYNNALVACWTLLSTAYFARRLFPPLRINPVRHFDREVFWLILRFSWKVQVTNITQLLIFQLDRILLSHFVGLGAVSTYEIASKLAAQARAFVATVFTPMVPAASSLQADNNIVKVVGLYRRAFKYMALLSVVVAFLLIALAHPFIEVWVGTGYDKSALTLQVLVALYLVNLLTAPGAFVLSGINRPEIGMISSIVAGTVNVVGCLILVQLAGYYGVIAGIGISLTSSAIFFLAMVHRELPDLDWRLYGNALTRPLLVAGGLAAVLMVSGTSIRLDNFGALAAAGVIFMVAYAAAMLPGKYLDDFDRETLRKQIPWSRIRS